MNKLSYNSDCQKVDKSQLFLTTMFPAANYVSRSSDRKENFRRDELLNTRGLIIFAFSMEVYYNTQIYSSINCDTQVKFLIQEGHRLRITGINISLICRTKVNAYIFQTFFYVFCIVLCNTIIQ